MSIPLPHRNRRTATLGRPQLPSPDTCGDRRRGGEYPFTSSLINNTSSAVVDVNGTERNDGPCAEARSAPLGPHESISWRADLLPALSPVTRIEVIALRTDLTRSASERAARRTEPQSVGPGRNCSPRHMIPF